MGTIKAVQQVLAPPAPHMVGDGFRVHNFFPSGYNMGQKRMSPFFLMDYNSKIDFSPSETPRGVDVHPHRGFETVTIAFHGKVAHHDSAGNSGVIGEGDVQWMTAGFGVLHKEYHELEFSRKGGLFQMVQLWVNLPAKYKLTKPKYQGIQNDELGKYFLPNNKGLVDVIAGEYNDVKGPASTFTPIEMYVGKVKKDAELSFTLPENYNTGIIVTDGTLRINDIDEVPLDHFCLFKNEGTDFSVKAVEDSVFLVLSGEPIDEPIVAHGPFLMNTVEEIREAIHDFSTGKFGRLK